MAPGRRPRGSDQRSSCSAPLMRRSARGSQPAAPGGGGWLCSASRSGTSHSRGASPPSRLAKKSSSERQRWSGPARRGAGGVWAGSVQRPAERCGTANHTQQKPTGAASPAPLSATQRRQQRLTAGDKSSQVGARACAANQGQHQVHQVCSRMGRSSVSSQWAASSGGVGPKRPVAATSRLRPPCSCTGAHLRGAETRGAAAPALEE